MSLAQYQNELHECARLMDDIRSLYNQVQEHRVMVTKSKPKKRKTAIGTPRKPRAPLTPEGKGKIYQELLYIETDIGQLGKAVGRSDYKTARKQLNAVIKRLQKIRL